MASKIKETDTVKKVEGEVLNASTDVGAAGNDTVDGAVTDAVKTEVAKQRTRRVSIKLELPKVEVTKNAETGEETEVKTPGKINLIFPEGQGEPFVYEVDFDTIAITVLQAAALSGIATKFATAYAGETTREKIVAAVQEEIDLLAKGEFTSRTLAEKASEYPDVIIAWINSVGADSTDKVTLDKYKANYEGRNKEDKAKIDLNGKVIVELEKIRSARALAKKLKTAKEEDALEVL